jgi:PAS domain S-box-containing protein
VLLHDAEAAEAKFRGLLESAPDAIVIVDSHGHIAVANAQAESLFGHPRDRLIGAEISELIPRRLRARHREHVRAFLRDPSTRAMGSGLELHGLHADGHEIPVEISLSPLQTDEGLLVSAAIRDVSARIQAVAELADAEALFRGAFEGSPIGMALADRDGRMVRVNDALIALTGRTPDQLLNVPFVTLTHPDHLERDRAALESLLAGDVGWQTTETRWIHASGDVLWVALQVTRIAAGGTAGAHWLLQIQDITHRKHYEDNLQYLATHDALTGLHNRASFAQRLDAHAELVSRYGTEGSVLLLDLDHFKYINDTLGHQAGDQLVSRVA